ncbi:MAG TPA: helix-turn-helix domain-containing protein [Acidimicrobiales bacterium]|nr:helix-turn-helix domain-containing protein [Acidimicrobiales bacterium]
MVDLMLDGADTATLLQWLAHRVGLALSLVRHDGHPLFHAPVGGSSVKDMLDCRARATLSGRTPISMTVPSPVGGVPLLLTLPCGEETVGPLEHRMLARACDLLSLSLLRRRQEETLLARENGDFLNGLINGELAECEAETRAAEPHWVSVESLLPAVLGGRTPQELRQQQESWAVIMRSFQQEMVSHGVPVVAGLIGRGDGGAVIIGVPCPRRTGGSEGLERRAELVDRAAKTLAMHVARHLPGGRPVSLCVGESASSWVDVGVRLREVFETAPTVLPDAAAPWIDFGRLDIDLLIRRLLGNETLERFVERRLAALEEHDRTRRSELIRTLEALFEHNGNKADTARALYLERQSLYSRLERIEELLGESLGDEGTRLGLQLALRVRRGRASVSAL